MFGGAGEGENPFFGGGGRFGGYEAALAHHDEISK
jgi:hypothetical protein